MKLNLGKYGKFWTAIIGLGLTVATAKYSGTTWLPYVIAAASALGVYGVPNSAPVKTAVPSLVQEAPKGQAPG